MNKLYLFFCFCWLFCFTDLLAKPDLSTYSIAADTVLLDRTILNEDIAMVGSEKITDSETGVLVSTVVVVGDFCGQGTGFIDLTPDPATQGPWMFIWSNGATTEDISGLLAGTYTVIITDANNGHEVLEVVVTDLPPAMPTASHFVATGNTVCIGAYNGALDITILPLSAPWTYEWSTGATTQDVSGLNSGTYTVTVTIGATCHTPIEFTVPDDAGSPFISFFGTANSTCEREDGVAGVIPAGGVTPYTYLWTNGGTNLAIQDVFAGTYTVTVTDANGCTVTQELTVGNTNWPIVIEEEYVTLVPNTTCNGGNGSINIGIVHPIAQGPFDYQWSNGATGSSISNLPSGSYFVTITFNPACFTTDVFYIEDEPVIPNLAVTPTPTTCGNSNGFANLTVTSGGLPPFTYEWSNGATTQDLANIPADTYDVTVTSINNGCTVTTSVTIDDTPILFNYSAVVTDHNACDTSNGQINLSLFPSTLAYTWSNGATTKILKNLAPGDYTVTISAGGTCTSVETYSVGDVTEYPIIPLVPMASTCGLANGGVDLTLLGEATAPVTYLWSNGATTQDISGLQADTFSVTVTSAVGCSVENTVIVPNQNDTLHIQATVLDNISCSAPSGNIALDITPTDSSYTYVWSSGQTVDSLSNLSAGTYYVTVTLGLSCTAIDTFEVLNNALPPNLLANASSANCGLDIGSIDLWVNNGSGPFQYLWSNAATTEDLQNLPPGTYSVTVTGANDCTSVISATVQNNNLPLSVNGTTIGNTSCTADNGTINIGVSPAGMYHYLWSNAAITEDLDNLASGTYTVTVSLGNCLSSGTFSVADNAVIPSFSTAITAADCGLSTGAIDLNVNNGAGPFTFLWSNAAVTEDITGLSPDTYFVTVTGTNGCSAQSSTTVLSNNIALNINGISSENTSCTAANGALDISVAPAGAYSYLWSNMATTEDVNNLSSGPYSVTVTWGTCQSSSSFSVADNTATPLIASNIIPAICSLNNGSIDLDISGTAGPYTYLWSNLETTEDLTNVLPGNYWVTVTAPSGCTQMASLNVPNNASTFSLAGTPAALTNCAADNGAIDLTITPAGAFTYLWSNAATTEDLNGLMPGTYTVSVTQAGSCTATASYFVLDQRTNPSSTQSIVSELCGLADGSIDLSVSGGTAPFNYVWTSGQMTQDLSGIAAGTYTVTVTDANDCTVTSSAVVPSNSIHFSLAGTPTSNSSCLQNNGTIDLTVNPGGAFAYVWSNFETTQDLSGLNGGTYTVTVSAGGNCTNTAVFTLINDLPSPQILDNIAAATCGASSGGIDLSVSGSMAPYQFVWSNAAITEDLSGVVSNTYSVTVTAANGCTTVDDFVVPENTFTPTIGSQIVSTTSCITNNGAIDLSITPAANGPYTYEWSNMVTTEDQNNLAAGTYTVTVSAGAGCTNTAMLQVGSTIPVPMLMDNVAAATCGASSGSIDLSVSGSPAPHQFIWSNAAITEDISGLVSNTYSVTVTAANGCTSVGNYTVPENTILPQMNGAITVHNSCLSNNGAIDLNVGPATNYTFIWSNAVTTEDQTNLGAGEYTVTVNGGGACTGTASYLVADQTTQPQANINTSITTLDCSITETTLQGTVTGTPNPSSFQWLNNNTPLGTGSNLLVTTPGVYDLVVEDAVTFCTATASIVVSQSLNPPDLSVTSPALLTCHLPAQTLTGTSTIGGVQFSWALINGADTTLIGQNAALTVDAVGTYFLFALNPANNCTNATAVVVNSDQIPPMANAGQPFTIDCAGETIPIHGSGSGAANLSYQWTSQDGHIVSGGNSATPLINLAGTYQLLVTNLDNGCTDTDLVTIEPEIPQAYASIIQPTCLIQDGTVRIDSVTGLSNPILYSLNHGPTNTQNQFSNLVPGAYTLTVLGGNGCDAALDFVIEPPLLPLITLLPQVTVVLGYGYEIAAQLNIPPGDIASIAWTPSTDLSCDSCLSTLAMPYNNTNYELVVVTDAGCEARGHIQVTVDKRRHIYAPNIFTPDDEGANALFSIYGDPANVLKIKSLQVYSRWGESVYEQRDFGPNEIATGWDGTLNGQKMNPGVFVWQAVVQFIDGKEEMFVGDVTIVR